MRSVWRESGDLRKAQIVLFGRELIQAPSGRTGSAHHRWRCIHGGPRRRSHRGDGTKVSSRTLEEQRNESGPLGTFLALCAQSKASLRRVPTRKQGSRKYCLNQSEPRSFSISYSCNWGLRSSAHGTSILLVLEVPDLLRRKP